MKQMLLLMAEGTLTSIKIFVLTLLFALPFGFVVAKGRMSKSKAVSRLVNLYIQIMRGTPLILQLIFVYFAPAYLFKRAFYDRFTAVIIAFVINYAAYFAEIYRGGIQAIPRGQYEAAKVLGFSKAYTFFHIVLPQVIKNILPSLSNEVITLVKDTALAQTIGVAELFRVAQNASSRQFSTLPIFVAGVFYFIMNYLVSKAFEKGEKKLAYYR
jgi:amine acid ABC transporter, permease protein, 3-TM region, His/Glu/Gln/Arg/opine family